MDTDFMSMLQNAYPTVQERMEDREFTYEELLKSRGEPIDEREVFDHIRDIKDPEHPLTLEQLGVVELDKIKINNKDNVCFVEFTPTIPHCSMATLIGLAIKVQLLRILPPRFKVEVQISPGTHAQEAAVNKQLSDKERVAAALENSYLVEVINECLLRSEEQDLPEDVQKLLEGHAFSENPRVRYVLRSRQSVKSYRRWLDIVNSQKKGIGILSGI